MTTIKIFIHFNVFKLDAFLFFFVSSDLFLFLSFSLCHVICWLFNCCGQGRKCTRKQKAWWLVIITFVFTFLLTIFISIEMYHNGAEPHILAWFSGGMCVLLGKCTCCCLFLFRSVQK